MTRFFQLWLAGGKDGKGMGKAEALRQAQLELIAALRKEPDAKRKQAPPLFWAGFICHGQSE
jgi:CHAT domain-containing protein